MAADPTDVAAELYARGNERLAANDVAGADELAARAVELFAAADSEHPDLANALLLRARVAHARSGFRDALELAERAAAILDEAMRKYPDEDVVIELRAQAAAEVAGALHALGRYDDAEKVLTTALAVVDTRLHPDAEVAGQLCNLLGIGHKYQARYDEAAASYERAGDIIRAHHGSDSLEMASLEHNLGGLAHARGEPALGEKHARRAIELREAVLGPEDPQVAADLAAWASLLADLSRHAEAEVALRRALDIFDRVYGERHFEVGFTLGSLGALLARGERWTEALPLLQRSHAILVAVLGANHLEVRRAEEHLAVVSRALARR